MARISKLRGRESFRRRPGRKLPRSITLIVCEGETEQEYFDVVRIHYGLTNAEVVIADNTTEAELWTHFFKGNKSCQLLPKFSRLDYLLLSRSLAASNPSRPNIERRGQPKRADRYSGPRCPGIGTNNPKASDHCPVVMEVPLSQAWTGL